MKYVTITINGIIQSVPEADVPQYLRAGYKVVEESAPEPEPAPVADPELDAAEESAPVKKSTAKK